MNFSKYKTSLAISLAILLVIFMGWSLFASEKAAASDVGIVLQFGTGHVTHPSHVAVNYLAGKVYVTDSASEDVKIFSLDGTYQSTFGGAGSGTAEFLNIGAIAVHEGSGEVYVSDPGNTRIQQFHENGAYVRSFDGSDSGLTITPAGIAVNQLTGDLYVTDAVNVRVVVLDGGGVYQRQWGTSGSGPGEFGSIVGEIAINPHNDDVFVVDPDHYKVQAFHSDGTYIASSGSPGTGPGKFLSPSGVAVNALGRVYVSDSYLNRIEEFTTDGTFVREWGSGGSADGFNFNNPQGLAMSDASVLYVADTGNSIIETFFNYTESPEITGASPVSMLDGSYTNNRQPSITMTLANPAGISGNLLYRIQLSQYSDGSHPFIDYVSSYSPAGDQTFTVGQDAGSGFYILGEAGQKLADGDYYWQVLVGSETGMTSMGFAPVSGGDVSFRVDGTAPRVHKAISSTNVPTQIRSWDGSAGYATLSANTFSATDAVGNIYVLDISVGRVQKYTADGEYLTSWTDGSWINPTGIAVGVNNYVYIVDQTAEKVKKYTTTGTFVSEWGSDVTDGGEFDHPFGIATDTFGNVYVTDVALGQVLVYSDTGMYLAALGSYGSGDGQFHQPVAVAVNSTTEHIYVLDNSLQRVQEFLPDTSLVRSWGSAGSGHGQFNLPDSLALDSMGNVIVGDRDNNRVQIFNATGTYLAQLGTGLGTSSPSDLKHPLGVSVGEGNAIYVGDEAGRIVQYGFTTAPNPTSDSTDITPSWIWDSYTDGNSGLATPAYNVQWSTDSTFGGGVLSHTSPSAGYIHLANLTAGTWYARVAATDAAGNTSPYSSAGSITLEVAEEVTDPTPTPTPTPSPTPTPTPSPSATVTPTSTPSVVASSTPSPSSTSTPTPSVASTPVHNSSSPVAETQTTPISSSAPSVQPTVSLSPQISPTPDNSEEPVESSSNGNSTKPIALEIIGGLAVIGGGWWMLRFLKK